MENSNEKGPLSYDDARAEADMMLALLKEAGIEESPSAEDYDAALMAMEDIVAAAESETDVDRAKLAIGKVLQGLGAVPMALLTGVEAFVTQFAPTEESRYPKEQEMLTDAYWEFNRQLTEQLKSAKSTLRNLEKAAENLEA